MSFQFKNLYEFGEFRLDTKEKILMRGEEQLEVTPKGFELLSVLVENHGLLLEKNALMEKIWADSFVEESNLTFNIRQLRKILDDDAQNPKYIKTVRGHGYRFIAEVKLISEANKPIAEDKPEVEVVVTNSFLTVEAPTLEQLPDAFEKPVVAPITPTKSKTIPAKAKTFLAPLLLGVIVLLVGAAVLGSWYKRDNGFAASAPVLSEPFSSEKLSTNGKIYHAVITPDGKSMVYTNGVGSDKQSLWLRQLDGGSNIEIIPPSNDLYGGLMLSPDGKTLYFARKPREAPGQMIIYSVPIFGGIPKKIISETQGWMSISPDGSKISFVRCSYSDNEFCSLWIADTADGQNERKVASRPHPFRIGDNRFSPDGKSIAFAVGQSVNSSNEFTLAEVDLENGAERELINQKFFNIKNLMWLPDKSGLLITAAHVPNKNFRIWQVSTETREVTPLTKDSETYADLSMNKDGTAIVATRVKEDFRIKLLRAENPSVASVLANGSSASFAPDGKIYFSSIMSGNEEIWSINADGSNQRQLTNNTADEFAPIVSPDNKTVFFVSNKSGCAQLWRMNTDGSNQTQMTQTDGGAPVFVSPDGEWVYYRHNLTSMLWRVSMKTGEQQLVLNKEKARFAFSPDGTQVAFSEKQGDEKILTIVSLADGKPVKTFHLADKKLILMHIAWMPDGKNLSYITANPGFVNKVLWHQSLDEEKPSQMSVLGDDEICEGFGLSISPDGKTFTLVQGGWLHDAVLLEGLR